MKLVDRVKFGGVLVLILVSMILMLVLDFSMVNILLFTTTAFVVLLAVCYISRERLIHRVEKFTHSVKEMSLGNFSRQLKVEEKDEFSTLVNIINDLMNDLQTGAAASVTMNKGLHQAKTDFVSLASHQLRTPLSVVKWYTDFLLAGDAGELNKEQRKYLKQVYNNNEKLIRLVNALLDVSRIDMGTFCIEPEDCSLINCINDSIKKIHKEIKEKGIRMQTNFDKIKNLDLDPVLTRIVFDNILSNSLKYTESGGIIRVRVKKTEDNILIKISDSGCGIPRAQQSKIFTKLFRADNVKVIESSGSGLGLYIVKAIVKKSGGNIWFESPSMELKSNNNKESLDFTFDRNNEGTTFFIKIPSSGMREKKGNKRLTELI